MTFNNNFFKYEITNIDPKMMFINIDSAAILINYLFKTLWASIIRIWNFRFIVLFTKEAHELNLKNKRKRQKITKINKQVYQFSVLHLCTYGPKSNCLIKILIIKMY